MKILHVSQPVDGGTATVVRQLAAGQAARGHHVMVACPEGELATWARDHGLDWQHLPLGRAPHPSDLTGIPRIRRWAAAADVVHLHSSKAGAVGRLALAGRRRPVTLFTPHGWSWYVGGPLARVYRLVERSLARVADHITVVSEGERREGAAVLGRRAARRLVLVENGIDTAAFPPQGQVAMRRPEPLLVCVGRLSEQKGQDLLLRALAALPDPSVRLRLVGDGPLGGELRALAQRLGVAHRVEFAGHADPRPHLRAADVVILSSRWEGMSLLLLEAMACGAAIISTDTDGCDALGDAGVVVPLARIETALPAAIMRLLDAPAERRMLRARAHARAVSHFDVSRVITRYEELTTHAGSHHVDR
jgi:glycosyltransferase involved in cell wall biosynthesis